MKRLTLLSLLLLAAAFLWSPRAQAEAKSDLEGKGYTCGKVAPGTTLESTYCTKCETDIITGTVKCTDYMCDKNGDNCKALLTMNPVTGVGDVTGDAVADVAVWDPTYGEVFVFSGVDNTLLYTLAAPDPRTRGDFGRWLTGVADMNGDAVPDLVVEESTRGQVFVFSGKDGTLLTPSKSPTLGRSEAVDLKSRMP
jgi:hypothetical protein